jgi:hypothetical protein
MFILGWIPKGRATASAMSPSWSLAGLVLVPAESAFVIGSAQRQNLRLDGVASDHRHNIRRGSSPSSACLGRSRNYTRTHIQQTSPAAPGI